MITLVFTDAEAVYPDDICVFFDTIRHCCQACKSNTILLNDPDIGITKEIFNWLLNIYRIRDNEKWIFGIPQYARQYAYLGGIPIEVRKSVRKEILESGNIDLIRAVYNAQARLCISAGEAYSVHHIPVMEHLLAHHVVDKTDVGICESAAMRGERDYLEFLHKNGFVWDDLTTWSAAANGREQCLAYAIHNGCVWDDDVGRAAVRYGHIECAKLLLDEMRKSGGISDDFCYPLGYAAAKSGSIKMMEYLRTELAPGEWWCSDVCAAAAKCGDLEMLKYVRTAFSSDSGLMTRATCDWNEATCLAAIRHGHMACLVFALTSDPPCPITEAGVADLMESGNTNCLCYAHEYLLDHKLCAHPWSVGALYLYDDPRDISRAIQERTWSETRIRVRAYAYIRCDSIECFEAAFAGTLCKKEELFSEMFIAALVYKSCQCIKYLARMIPYNDENKKHWPIQFIRETASAFWLNYSAFLRDTTGVDVRI